MKTISFASQIYLENVIEVWKLDGINPDLQDDVELQERAFSFRGSVILWLLKNVIILFYGWADLQYWLGPT
jgi:hypothetical protein